MRPARTRPDAPSRQQHRRCLSAKLVTCVVVLCSASACTTVLTPDIRFGPHRISATEESAPPDLNRVAGESLRHTVRIGDEAIVRAALAKRVRHAKLTAAQPLPEESTPSPFDADHPSIDHFIHHYSEVDPKIVSRSLRRAAPHLPMIRDTLDQAGVPEELALLPIVESHFRASAHSRAGAAGIWQFMPHTAQRYGLRIDTCVDERKDRVRSSEAAARYLSYLHSRFGDWPLALAAYNGGETRIDRIMRTNGVDDYWTMVDRGLLSRETAQFVPRFLAVVTVVDNARAFGFVPPEELAGDSQPTAIEVDTPLSLKTVAKLAGVDRTTIERLNPALACKRVPRGGYDVHIPRDRVAAFELEYASFDSSEAADEDGLHRVRSGENPASIARRYGVSVRDLMRENGIRNPRRLKVNTRLRIPDAI